MLSKTVMVLGSFFLWCMWSETDEKNREAKSYRVGEITMQIIPFSFMKVLLT